MKTSKKAPDAAEITARSKSNLALGFIALPPERRSDAATFYAFCRVIDDIADDPELALDEKQRRLDEWKLSLFGPQPSEPPLAGAVRALIAKYRLRENHLIEIIAGMEMDLAQTRYETFRDLRLYCYRVASVVGLVSIEIFGCKDEGSKRYAVELGLALQLTNILRDVHEDLAQGRIYLPKEDLERAGLAEADFPISDYSDPRWLELMHFEAARARQFFREARLALPSADRRALAPAEMMRRVYERLLRKMERDGFRTGQRRYRLSGLEKVWAIAPVLARVWTWRVSTRSGS
jgi:phytoene synthase